jgi:hypothetical protein
MLLDSYDALSRTSPRRVEVFESADANPDPRQHGIHDPMQAISPGESSSKYAAKGPLVIWELPNPLF